MQSIGSRILTLLHLRDLAGSPSKKSFALTKMFDASEHKRVEEQ